MIMFAYTNYYSKSDVEEELEDVFIFIFLVRCVLKIINTDHVNRLKQKKKCMVRLVDAEKHLTKIQHDIHKKKKILVN